VKLGSKRNRSPAKPGSSPSPKGKGRAKSTDEAPGAALGNFGNKMDDAATEAGPQENYDIDMTGLENLGISDLPDLPSDTPLLAKTPAPMGNNKEPSMTHTHTPGVSVGLTTTIPAVKRVFDEDDEHAERAIKSYTVTSNEVIFYGKKKGQVVSESEVGKREYLKRKTIWEDMTHTDLESQEWQVKGGLCEAIGASSSSDMGCTAESLCSYCFKRVRASKEHQLRIAYALCNNEVESFHVDEVSLNPQGFQRTLIRFIVNLGLIDDDASLTPSQLWQPP